MFSLFLFIINEIIVNVVVEADSKKSYNNFGFIDCDIERNYVKQTNEITSNGRIKMRQMTEFKNIIVSLHPNKVHEYEKRDIQRVDGVERDPVRVHRLMRSLARNQGSQASLGTIKADLASNESDTISEDTIASYIKALKEIFVVEDSEAWNPNLRSKSAIRTSDTRYFTDSSIATAALGLGPNDLINDLNTFGLFFETMAVRDLRIYAEPLNGKVYHFRDRNGLECDAVIHLRDGRYGLVEIKLGGDDLIDEGAAALKTLARKINTEKMKEPSFMMVLVGVGTYAYRREDSIYVVPIGCLKD